MNHHPTPETDADLAKVKIECEDSCIASWATKNGDTIDVVDADVARDLERRLAECREALQSSFEAITTVTVKSKLEGMILQRAAKLIRETLTKTAPKS
jgi:hypothetical protein